jgi:hypothetical protein
MYKIDHPLHRFDQKPPLQVRPGHPVVKILPSLHLAFILFL